MARSEHALNFRTVPWAGGEDADENRDDIPLALRREGWGPIYSQIGGKVGPERLYVNQLLREITGLLVELNRAGPILPHSMAVNYVHHAFVMGDDGVIYVSLSSSGPATGDAIAPTADSQTKWRLY